MAGKKQHRRTRTLKEADALRVKEIQEEAKTKEKDPPAAIAAIEAALVACNAHGYDPHHKSWAHRMMVDEAARHQLCIAQFALGDTDGGGDLDFDEAVGTVQKLVTFMSIKRMPTKKKFEEWMAKFDTNKDGSLSLDEFERGFLSVVTSMVKEVEYQEANENKLHDDEIITLLGYCDDVDLDDVYVEEPRVVVEDDDDEEVRSMWGDGDKNPADADEE